MNTHALSTLLTTALAAIILLAGCAEKVMIRSQPATATAYVNDRPAGTTPFVFAVPKGELEHSYRVHLEKEGYEPYTEIVGTRIAPGRIVGAVFTLGIVYLFRSPRYLVPPQLMVMQPSSEGERDRHLGKELRELEKLRTDGRITPEEFDRRRKELFDEDK